MVFLPFTYIVLNSRVNILRLEVDDEPRYSFPEVCVIDCLHSVADNCGVPTETLRPLYNDTRTRP